MEYADFHYLANIPYQRLTKGELLHILDLNNRHDLRSRSRQFPHDYNTDRLRRILWDNPQAKIPDVYWDKIFRNAWVRTPRGIFIINDPNRQIPNIAKVCREAALNDPCVILDYNGEVPDFLPPDRFRNAPIVVTREPRVQVERSPPRRQNMCRGTDCMVSGGLAMLAGAACVTCPCGSLPVGTGFALGGAACCAYGCHQ